MINLATAVANRAKANRWALYAILVSLTGFFSSVFSVIFF